MKTAIAICSLALLATAAMARDWDDFTAREPAVKQPGHQEWTWDGGDSLSLQAPAVMHYMPGGTPRIVITGPEDLLSRVRVGQGHIRIESGPDWFWHSDERLQVTVTGVTVHNIALSGSGEAHLEKLDLDHLNLAISGSGSITGEGRSDRLQLSMSGSGRADLTRLVTRDTDMHISGSARVTDAGRGEHLKLNMSGSGRAELAQLAVRMAEIHVSGNGHVSLSPREEANVSVAGSGVVTMASRPAHLSQSVRGSGRIHVDGERDETRR